MCRRDLDEGRCVASRLDYAVQMRFRHELRPVAVLKCKSAAWSHRICCWRVRNDKHFVPVGQHGRLPIALTPGATFSEQKEEEEEYLSGCAILL